MTITASELRQNVYRLLDEVLESGAPLDIERNGRRLRIVALDSPSKLSRLTAHPDTIVGDPRISSTLTGRTSGARDPAGHSRHGVAVPGP